MPRVFPSGRVTISWSTRECAWWQRQEAQTLWMGEYSQRRPAFKQMGEESWLLPCLLLCLKAAGPQEPGQPIEIMKHEKENSSQKEDEGSSRRASSWMRPKNCKCIMTLDLSFCPSLPFLSWSWPLSWDSAGCGCWTVLPSAGFLLWVSSSVSLQVTSWKGCFWEKGELWGSLSLPNCMARHRTLPSPWEDRDSTKHPPPRGTAHALWAGTGGVKAGSDSESLAHHQPLLMLLLLSSSPSWPHRAWSRGLGDSQLLGDWFPPASMPSLRLLLPLQCLSPPASPGEMLPVIRVPTPKPPSPAISPSSSPGPPGILHFPGCGSVCVEFLQLPALGKCPVPSLLLLLL